MLRVIERHQIEGLDERRRVFNRLADIQREDKGYTALFHYEGLTFKTPASRTIDKTLAALIGQLHEKGFSNLRTRLNFRGKRYFAEREEWVVHPDPEPISS